MFTVRVGGWVCKMSTNVYQGHWVGSVDVNIYKVKASFYYIWLRTGNMKVLPFNFLNYSAYFLLKKARMELVTLRNT